MVHRSANVPARLARATTPVVDSGLWAPMALQVEALRRDGHGSAIVCGATDLARAAIQELTMAGIKVRAVADRQFTAFPVGFAGAPVLALETALAGNPEAVLIATILSAPALRREIETFHLRKRESPPAVYSIW